MATVDCQGELFPLLVCKPGKADRDRLQSAGKGDGELGMIGRASDATAKDESASLRRDIPVAFEFDLRPGRNPARPTRQIIACPRRECKQIAGVKIADKIAVRRQT